MLHLRRRWRPEAAQAQVPLDPHRREHAGNRARVHGTSRARCEAADPRWRSLSIRAGGYVQESRQSRFVAVTVREIGGTWN